MKTLIKGLAQMTLILIGLACWFLFALALMGCQGTEPDPVDAYSLPPICAMSDSTVKVFGKIYKAGKTKNATVYVDSDGALWLRWPDGTQKSYDEGQVYFCDDQDKPWDSKIKGEE
jgi:hypothetical protein